MKKMNFDKETISYLEETVQSEEQAFKEFILKEIIPTGAVAPNSVKTLSFEKSQNLAITDQLLQKIKSDLNHTIDLYTHTAHKKELAILHLIFNKITFQILVKTQKAEVDPITDEDCEFLEEIAKRSLVQNHCQEASSMYRLIIQIKPNFSAAWVGWAAAELQLNHKEIVESIFKMALDLLPEDYFILLFAVDFYNSQERFSESKQLLEGALKKLNDQGNTHCHTYYEIEKELKAISKSRNI